MSRTLTSINIAQFFIREASAGADKSFKASSYPGCVPPWKAFVAFVRNICCTCAHIDAAELLSAETDITKSLGENLKDADSFVHMHLFECDADGPLVEIGMGYLPLKGTDCAGRNMACVPIHPDAPGELKFVGLLITAACAFANCKNVKITKAPISRQVRRFAERRGIPVFEHHILEINPMKEVLRTEGKLSEHGDFAKALHLCRGHFARYGEQFGTGKLFGKYEGQFWVPQHIRGKLEKGVVTKDYAINA